MKKISTLLSRKLLTLFGASAILFAPVFVLADDYGLSKTASAAGLAGNSDLTSLVGNIIGSALSLVGIVFFILMVYGGFLWMIARGKEETVNKAKDTIIAAIIGLIIVFASYALTSFIFSSLDGRAGGNNTNNDPFTDGEDIFYCADSTDCATGESCVNSECLIGRPSGTIVDLFNDGYCVDIVSTPPCQTEPFNTSVYIKSQTKYICGTGIRCFDLSDCEGVGICAK